MLKTRNVLLLQQRWKSRKPHWSALQRKKTNTDRALSTFDDFYGSVFGVRWKNMRVALLTEHKYVALVNNFGDTEKICSQLEMDGAINVRTLIELAKEKGSQERIAFGENKNTTQLDEKLQYIQRVQERREIEAIYPMDRQGESGVTLPERLQYRKETADEKESLSEKNNTSVGSNHEDAEQNVHIDESRMVDPALGSGALYEFIPATQLKGMEDWIPESDHYRYYQTNADFPLKYEPELKLNFPENLSLYTYDMGNCSEFKSPRRCVTGVLSHYLLDGASILPPLMLDVRHGDRVLDACAAPGGKSLLLLQTLYPRQVVCNDLQESRMNRIRKVMQEYIFDYKERWEGRRLVLQYCDARKINEYESYDKILVDVPCTTDRHSLMENDNNIFKPTRVKERLRLPELQAGILANCIRLLKPGGSLVYSTCSLSPVQNDGVVHMALQKVFSEHGITATIKDLSSLTALFSDIYRFEHPGGLKYGQMVIPYLPANFGPMYFSKLTRDT